MRHGVAWAALDVHFSEFLMNSVSAHTGCVGLAESTSGLMRHLQAK
jgi:hypothetical protein